MSDRPYGEKLVRDGIPAIIQAAGREAAIRPVSDAEVAPYVHRKVLEEAAELYEALRAGDPEKVRLEAADLLEIMRRATALADVGWDAVEAARLERVHARGAFAANLLYAGPGGPEPRVYGEGSPSLLAALAHQLRTCSRASIAVSFGMRSGVGLLGAHLAAALRDGRTIRLLTSDYLDVTEPEALEELLDLGGDLQLRLYHEPGRSFHAKCYLFEHADGRNVAFVGSSNLSRSALEDGIEWNYLVRETDDGWSMIDLLRRFEALFTSPFSYRVDRPLIDAYRARRRPRAIVDWAGPPTARPTPNGAQREAIAELNRLRAEGERRALVVAATGVGKTFLAAFDSEPYARVLFLAHREELLTQASQTFAQVRPDARLGLYAGGRHEADADVLFANVATLGRTEHLARFQPDRFDYVVVDEFHHAAARSYQAILHYFAPRFLLGLTATPYRGDNRDVFALCDGNVAYRVDFMEAIALGWLAPFRYFGIHDDTDYAGVTWRNGRYDVDALTASLNTARRAQAVRRAFEDHASRAAIGFCVSIAHAEAMAAHFMANGVPALAVHSGPGAPERGEAIAALRRGEVRVLFTVDLFNEGVDVPELDLVMFLRPTESVTVFLQQLGRGLRLSPGKDHLVVLDFIGNYRRAHFKVPLILGTLTDDPTPASVRTALAALAAGTLALPPGVEIRFDLQVVQLMEKLARLKEPRRAAMVADFEAIARDLGERPSLLALHRLGRFDVRAYRQEFGPWHALLAHLGVLTPEEQALEAEAGTFLAFVEQRPMTRSYTMVVLAAFVRLGGLRRPVAIDALVAAFRAYFLASPRHARDLVGTEVAAIADVADDHLRAYVLRNPLAAWTNAGRDGQRAVYFALDAERDVLAYTGPPASRPAAFEAAVAERAEYRLAAHFEVRYERQNVFNVINAGADRGIIMLGQNDDAPVPRGAGWVRVRMNDRSLWAKFAAVAINMVKVQPVDAASEANLLTSELEAMFGPGGFLPQRGHRVRIVPAADAPDTWEILPFRPGRGR